MYHKKFIYAEANDPEIIKNGFDMTRDIQEIIDLYDQLTQQGTIDIKSIKDSKKRQNITSKPDDDGTLRTTERLPVLHSRINLLKWYENAAYYHNAQFGMADGNIPTRGQGKKKTLEEEWALAISELIFKDLAKNGELNLPLGNIYEILSKFLVRLDVCP